MHNIVLNYLHIFAKQYTQFKKEKKRNEKSN